MEFIDIHGHYAWNIDDGIRNQKEAHEALLIAKENNIIKIIATPHIICGRHDANHLRKVLSRIHELKDIAAKYDIEVYQGSELFINYDFKKQLLNELYLTLANSRYLLVEYDVRQDFNKYLDLEDNLYEISIKGLIPILAHIERYYHQKLDIKRIRNLYNEGYIIQINSGSILGLNGKKARKYAYKLLDEGLVHIIASDTHSTSKRKPNLKEVYEVLSKRYAKEDLDILMYINPLHIIKDEKLININKRKNLINKLLGG